MYIENRDSGFYRKNILYDCSIDFIVNFEQIAHIVPVSLLLPLNKFH